MNQYFQGSFSKKICIIFISVNIRLQQVQDSDLFKRVALKWNYVELKIFFLPSQQDKTWQKSWTETESRVKTAVFAVQLPNWTSSAEPHSLLLWVFKKNLLERKNI